ncbi:MAG: PAS domain-containing protein [Gaiellaceae bacterium]
MLRGRRTSERTAAHQQLLLSELPAAFVWTTSPDLRLTSIAGSALGLIGVHDASPFLGVPVADILAGGRDGGAAVLDAHRRALDGHAGTLHETSSRWAFDVHLKPLYAGEEIVGVGGIAIDVSKRSVAEHALLESEARFQTLVERLPICTYVNPLGFPIRTTYISPYIETLLGFPAERWLTEDEFWVTRLHPEDRQRMLDAVNKTHETGAGFSGTYRMIHKDGRVVHLLDETVPVSDDQGRPLFLQGFLLDVGDRAALRQPEPAAS